MSCRQLLIEAIRHALSQGSDEDVVRCLHVVHALFTDAFCALPSHNETRAIDQHLWLCIADQLVGAAGCVPSLEEVMKREPVESSAVSSIGYNEALHVLEIEFKGGGIYQYLDVPKHEHEALMTAESIGTHVNTVIKPRYRDYRQVYD